MFTKRCLSVVMVALLVQPQLLVCGDNGLDDSKGAAQEQEKQVDTNVDEALKASSASNETVAARNTTVVLPGGITISTDDRRVQAAIAFAIALGVAKYFGLIGGTNQSPKV